MKHSFASALREGWPNCQWSLYNDGDFSTLQWFEEDIPKPSLDEVNKKIIELDSKEAKRLLRLKRNELLQETDIKSLPDFPHKTLQEKEAWMAYRQQLRDFPSSVTPSLNSNYDLDMDSVEWPIKPS